MVEAYPLNARDEILQRIRNALSDAPAPVDIPRDYRPDTGLDHEGVLELFAETVADYRATVHRTDDKGRAHAIAEILAGRGLRRIAVPIDLASDWLPDEIESVVDAGQLTGADLDAVDGALTGAALGIAVTGTLILDGSVGQGRRLLSLIPDYHLCVIDADQVVGSVPEAIRRLDPRRPITLISGPSATSDIELRRVEGVHGPRTLDVLLVE